MNCVTVAQILSHVPTSKKTHTVLTFTFLTLYQHYRLLINNYSGCTTKPVYLDVGCLHL